MCVSVCHYGRAVCGLSIGLCPIWDKCAVLLLPHPGNPARRGRAARIPRRVVWWVGVACQRPRSLSGRRNRTSQGWLAPGPRERHRWRAGRAGLEGRSEPLGALPRSPLGGGQPNLARGSKYSGVPTAQSGTPTGTALRTTRSGTTLERSGLVRSCLTPMSIPCFKSSVR